MFGNLFTLLFALIQIVHTAAQVCIAPTTTVATTTATPTCPTGWSVFGSNCYLLVNNKVTASAANQACMAMGAHLVSIHSTAENNFILNMITAVNTNVWSSLVRIGTGNADFAYIDGTPFDYTNWAAGQPSYTGVTGNVEFCGEVWTNGQINDLNCGLLNAYICEKAL